MKATIEIQPKNIDPHALHLEQLRAEIIALSKDGGLRFGTNMPAVALLVTSTPPSSGEFKVTATWHAPTGDPALGGALLFAGLMAVKQQAPAVFDQMIARLRTKVDL